MLEAGTGIEPFASHIVRWQVHGRRGHPLKVTGHGWRPCLVGSTLRAQPALPRDHRDPCSLRFAPRHGAFHPCPQSITERTSS
ncbi:hypothetical protein C8241_13460 [Paracidovorax avenae]|nr:hypothetical protein C8241_13460 [Paracidovorax avenae]